MSPSEYSYALRRVAFEYWRNLSDTEQQGLVDFFNWLAAHPFYESTIIDYDENGRKVSISPCGEHVVTHWTDHAVREVRINEIAGD